VAMSPGEYSATGIVMVFTVAIGSAWCNCKKLKMQRIKPQY